jgi:hypothetical protein
MRPYIGLGRGRAGDTARNGCATVASLMAVKPAFTKAIFRATPAAAISSWSEQRPEPVVLYSEFSVWSAHSSSKWIDFIVEMSCVHAD